MLQIVEHRVERCQRFSDDLPVNKIHLQAIDTHAVSFFSLSLSLVRMLCCILSVCWVVLVSVFSDISPCTGDVGPTRSQVKTKVKKFDFLMIEQLTRAVRHKPEPDELDQLLKKSYSSLMRAPLDPCQLFSRLLFMLFNWPSETEGPRPYDE